MLNMFLVLLEVTIQTPFTKLSLLIFIEFHVNPLFLVMCISGVHVVYVY